MQWNATEQKATTAMNDEQLTKYEGRCDVCEHGDNHWGHVLQKCSDCGVLVHEACYGLEQSSAAEGKKKRTDWVCRACELKENQPDGKRATRCVLCSVSGGVHAMHPIYDKEGPDGKQVQRPSGPAWAHTLCCMFIGSHRKTRGCVFLCNEQGKYDGEGEEEVVEEEEDTTGSSNDPNTSTSSLSTAKSSPNVFPSVEAHHFVVCRAGIPSHGSHYALIKSYRKELRCATCHVKDNAAKVLRLPVQCCSGDEGEQVFANCHSTRTYCYTAQHVGCARWKVDARTGLPAQHTRVFFWPGALDVDDEDIVGPMAKPIAEIYCGRCAGEIDAYRKKEMVKSSPLKTKKRKSVTSDDVSPEARKKEKKEISLDEKAAVKKEGKEKKRPSMTKKKDGKTRESSPRPTKLENDDASEQATPTKRKKRSIVIEDDSSDDDYFHNDPNAVDL